MSSDAVLEFAVAIPSPKAWGAPPIYPDEAFHKCNESVMKRNYPGFFQNSKLLALELARKLCADDKFEDCSVKEEAVRIDDWTGECSVWAVVVGSGEGESLSQYFRETVEIKSPYLDERCDNYEKMKSLSILASSTASLAKSKCEQAGLDCSVTLKGYVVPAFDYVQRFDTTGVKISAYPKWGHSRKCEIGSFVKGQVMEAL